MARRTKTRAGRKAAGPVVARATRKNARATRTKKTAASAATRPAKRAKRAAIVPPGAIDVRELESMRDEIQRLARAAAPPRWNADPEDVRRSVMKLVLTLVQLIRQLLERQAIRRMDAGTLTAEETEAVGLALMRLDETIRDLAAQFGLEPGDLNLDLGPIGKLM